MIKSFKRSIKMKTLNLDKNNISNETESLKEENEYLKTLMAELAEKNKKLMSKLKDFRTTIDLLEVKTKKLEIHEKILKENEYLREHIDLIQTELINNRKQNLIKHSFNSPIIGLENIGNSCYMNSVLQCLFYTNELSNYFLGSGFKNLLNRSDLKLANKYHEILQNIFSNNKISSSNLSEIHILKNQKSLSH